MRKPIEELIYIHMVTDGTCEKCQSEENSFHKYMCDAHSHGMDKFGHELPHLIRSSDVVSL